MPIRLLVSAQLPSKAKNYCCSVYCTRLHLLKLRSKPAVISPPPHRHYGCVDRPARAAQCIFAPLRKYSRCWLGGLPPLLPAREQHVKSVLQVGPPAKTHGVNALRLIDAPKRLRERFSFIPSPPCALWQPWLTAVLTCAACRHSQPRRRRTFRQHHCKMSECYNWVSLHCA